MKNTPILFTPENAQKVYENKKSQTRRIVKPQPIGKGDYWDLYNNGPEWAFWLNDNRMSEPKTWKCPYGTVGTKLWVREAFQLWREGWDRTGHAIYKGGLCDKGGNVFEADEIGKWTPSIYMPKKYCRTWLELTAVRVERVQDCSREDAIAEGAADWEGECTLRDKRLTAVQIQYAMLWESIHGPGSWDRNPWVWCLSYKTVQP